MIVGIVILKVREICVTYCDLLCPVIQTALWVLERQPSFKLFAGLVSEY